jgi:FAD/FMN-containing dehydrogenase
MTRRTLLLQSLATVLPAAPANIVNDVHSELNETQVARIVRPENEDQLTSAIRAARNEGLSVTVSGSRHAMGGQQFGSGAVLLDMRGMNRVRHFDPQAALIDVEAGIEWPEPLSELSRRQGPEGMGQLGIFQKQTGADRLSLGGALAANVHGRGLTLEADHRQRRIVQAVNGPRRNRRMQPSDEP